MLESGAPVPDDGFYRDGRRIRLGLSFHFRQRSQRISLPSENPGLASECAPPFTGSVAAGCGSNHTPGKATLAGGRAASDGFAISGPCLLIQDGSPGVAFGTYALPNAHDALGYFVMFKYPHGSLAESGFAPRSSARSDANGLSASLDLDLHGRRFSIAHRITLNDARSVIADETLVIQDKAVDLSAGRFFYVDLTAKPLRIEQASIALPMVTANVQHAEEVERVVEEAIRALKASSPEVAKLVSRW
jgi:hypothetical protein